MSTITLSCLVIGENPYENVFEVVFGKNLENVTVNRLKKAIKEEKAPEFDNYATDKLKLWKVDISLDEENEKLKLVNEKINVNIKDELEGVELKPLSRISKHFSSQPADEHIHIIVQRPVETKEVHCTATYGRKSANFQWTVTREMVTLEGFKKKLCEYLTFPDGTENDHIVISRVIGGAGLKRKISTGKMRRKSDLSFQSATVESDTVEIVTERKVIQFSADEDLMSIIWTTNPKVDLEIVVDTYDYNGLSLFDGGVKDTPKEIRSLVIDELLRLHKTSQHITSANEATRCEFISRIIYGVASIFDVGNTIITVTKVKKEDINQGIAQNAVQLQTSIQRNPKKRSYDTAGLHEDVMYGIVSTAVDWVIIKLVSSSSENNSEGKVEVLLSSLSPSPLPINNSVLTREDLAKPVENLFGQIKWVDRLTKVEQNQTLQNALTANDNSSNNNSSNFNLVAEPMVTQHEKPSVDKEMDTLLPEELIPEELTEVIVSAVNISVMDQCDQKSLEDKETDAFLDEEYKKKVSDEIRQRNREKKLRDLDLPGTSDIPSSESFTSSHPIPNNPVLSEQNAKIKVPEIDIQPLIQELLIEPSEEDCVKVVNVEESDQSPAIKLAHLYEKTKFAEIRTIRAKQDEIMNWYCYRKYFEKRHSEILPGILKNGVITNKKAYELASGQIYDEMLQYLSGVSRVNLRKKTQLTKPIYMLINEIGEDKIM
ncbi:hypothetical protein GLOIN_2v1571020 [Rhizophagus clarus]|uniref:Crinkler effector protein N-terminal domain-containing protein n=1 Tax=Rhizophagus clarus TaxID=94130 RepID=A0A8H3L9M2_9GLOM|nr:hypothetical protein GLOIN_2v1571020 [Rhizophagus clarus]